MLIDTDAGPLLAIAPRDGFEDAVLGAEIVGADEQGERYRQHRLAAAAELSGVRAERAVATSASRPPGRQRRACSRASRVTLRSAGSAETLTVRTPSGKSSRAGARAGRDVSASAAPTSWAFTTVGRGQAAAAALRRQPVRQRGKRHRAPQPTSASATSRRAGSGKLGGRPAASCGSRCCWWL